MGDLYEVTRYEIHEGCPAFKTALQVKSVLGDIRDMGVTLGDKGILSKHRSLRIRTYEATKQYVRALEAIQAEADLVANAPGYKRRYMATLKQEFSVKVSRSVESFIALLKDPLKGSAKIVPYGKPKNHEQESVD